MEEEQTVPEADPMQELASRIEQQATQEEPDDDVVAEAVDPDEAADDAADDAPEDEEEETPAGRYKVTVTGDNGEITEQAVSFDELKAGYQRGKEVESVRSQAQAEVSRTFEQANQMLAQTYQASETKLTELNTLVMQALQVVSPADLLSLAQSDPAAYHQASARQGVLQGIQKQIAEAMDRTKSESGHAEQQRTMQRREAALKALTKAGITTAQVDKIYESAGKAYGFTPQELAANLDHRLVLLLKDAADMKAIRDKKPQIQNKVREAPKPPPPTRKTAQIETQKLVGRLSKSGGGTREDLAALLRMRG